MKWSFASLGLIILGLFGLLIIILFNEITVSNEQDYYNLKNAAEASMIDAVDVAYYRLTGEIKISKEKFVENFTRRFWSRKLQHCILRHNGVTSKSKFKNL